MKKSKRTKAIALLLSASTALSLAGCTNPLDSNFQTVYGPIDDENQVDDSIVAEHDSSTVEKSSTEDSSTEESTDSVEESTDSTEDTADSEHNLIDDINHQIVYGPPLGE